MPKKKKGDPELLLVSFCDVVTVTTCALFMALIVVVDQAGRTPVLRHTPIAASTTNTPVYFECRASQVFPIDRAKLASTLQSSSSNAPAPTANGSSLASLGELIQRDIGDEYYKIDTRYLMLGQFALLPRTNATGFAIGDLSNRLSSVLGRINRSSQYVVFLVRDDSFPVFRAARNVTVSLGYETGWEYLGTDEPITFVGALAKIKTQ
jgi:hypothetical protein